jgi:hypothetical protein
MRALVFSELFQACLKKAEKMPMQVSEANGIA